MAPGAPHDRVGEFEEVALPHMDALYNLALHLTRNGKDAEDLVQEAYLRAFRFFASYRSGTQIRAWLFRILRNTFINRYRARKARPDEVDFDKIEPVLESRVDPTCAAAGGTPTPERIVMDGILDGEIQEAFDALPEEYRTVSLLALVEDLPYKEIAAILSIPVGTVMSRLHRGRKLLQVRLADLATRKGIVKPPRSVD